MRIIYLLKKIFYLLINLVIILVVYLIFSPIWRETVHEDLTKTGKFLHISDGYLFVQEFGVKSDLPTLVFIHGIGEWSENWYEVINLLNPDKHHMITIDIPPSGTSLLHSSDYNWKTQGRRVREVLDLMKIENVILIGNSYGGQAALGAIKDLGPRCKGLILSSTITGLPSNQLEEVKKAPPWLNTLLKAPVLRNVLASLLTHELLTRPALEALVYDPKDITPKAYSVFRRAVGFSGINNRYSDWLPQVVAPDDITLAKDNNFFIEIKTPTLIIWGDKDKLTMPWQANRLNILIENSKLVLFPNVGHFPYLEEPQKFAFEIEEFLKNLN